MREIKFRGKMVDTGKWVYGFYLEEQYSSLNGDVRPYIVENSIRHEVFAETVGQYNGLKGKNGKEVYEGDIMKIIYHGTNSTYDIYRPVWWDNETTRFINASKKYEVIGNIHDNPELIGE